MGKFSNVLKLIPKIKKERPLTETLQLPKHLKESALKGGTDPVASQEAVLNSAVKNIRPDKTHIFNGETFIAQPDVPEGFPDAVTQLEDRLKFYNIPSEDLGFLGIVPENRTTTSFIQVGDNLPKKGVQTLQANLGYGATTYSKGQGNNIQTHLVLLPKKYMITNPDYTTAHDYVHKYFRMNPTYQIPGAEGLDPNEAIAIISGEIKPRFGIKAGEKVTEKHMKDWFNNTDPRLTNRYGFNSKIKDMSRFLDWVNKVAPSSLGIPVFNYLTGKYE